MVTNHNPQSSGHVLVLIFLLASFLTLREESDKKVQSFVRKTMQNAERALQSNDVATKTVLGIVIAQDFTATFKDMRVETVAYELGIHLVMAGIVALIIIYFVERQVRAFNHRELTEFRNVIAGDVWRAVCNRLVPKEVTDQIAAILQYDFIKKAVRYTIVLEELPGKLVGRSSGEDNSLVLLKRELRFTVENISSIDGITYLFRSKSSADKMMKIEVASGKEGFSVGEHLSFPRHEFLSVRGVKVTVKEKGSLLLEHPIELMKGESCEIIHTTYEILSATDEAYYVQRTPVIGFEVTVSNRITNRTLIDKVYLSHPEREKFFQRPAHGDDQVWAFPDKAILPGQMFAVRWKEKPPPASKI